METQYQEVKTDDGEEHRISVRSALRQSLICSGVWMQYIMAGLCVGAPTVIIPQMRRELNGTMDEDLTSWLYVIPVIIGIPWALILPFLTNLIGRKTPQLVASFVSFTVFLILYYSRTMQHVLISELVQGYMHAVNTTVGVLSITEYTSPRLRGFFLTFTAAAFYWGVWMSNAIGTFFHWKNIALVGIACSVYTLTVVFWPESPYWLASKRRIDECKTSYRWLHGAASEKELDEIILVKQKDMNLSRMTFLETLQCPEFYKPLMISIVVGLQFLLSGKMVCVLYILDIFKNVTTSESSAYMAMLILDGATVLCIYVGTYLSKILKRRSLYLSSAFTAVFFLFSISLYLFLVKLELFSVNNYVMLALLIAFSVSISLGPMILASILYGELVSTRFQTISYSIVVLTVAVSYSTWVKLAPNIFAAFGLHGSFLFYGIASGLCTVFLYFYLPETKDKTQREIDDFFRIKEDILTNNHITPLTGQFGPPTDC